MNKLQQVRRDRAYQNSIQFLISRIEMDDNGILCHIKGKWLMKYEKHPRYHDLYDGIMDEIGKRNTEDKWDKVYALYEKY
jgi:hypothetical protein